jgi:putative copper resistance protein D
MGHSWYLFCVYLHILFAMIWVGGMLFFVFVIVPLLKKPELKEMYGVLISNIGKRYRILGWISLVMLIVTGILQMGFRGYSLSSLWNASPGNSFLEILRIKVLLVVVILLVSMLHDFWVGPSVSQQKGEKQASFRKAASWLGRANLVLALAVVALAVMLVRIPFLF